MEWTDLEDGALEQGPLFARFTNGRDGGDPRLAHLVRRQLPAAQVFEQALHAQARLTRVQIPIRYLRTHRDRCRVSFFTVGPADNIFIGVH